MSISLLSPHYSDMRCTSFPESVVSTTSLERWNYSLKSSGKSLRSGVHQGVQHAIQLSTSALCTQPAYGAGLPALLKRYIPWRARREVLKRFAGVSRDQARCLPMREWLLPPMREQPILPRCIRSAALSLCPVML